MAPERVHWTLPAGLLARVRAAAEDERTTASEWLRRASVERLERITERLRSAA
jgi:hypothetical protein